MSKDKQRRESRKRKVEQFYAADNVLVKTRGKLTKADRAAIESAARILENQANRR
jgi:hypothetical protein